MGDGDWCSKLRGVLQPLWPESLFESSQLRQGISSAAMSFYEAVVVSLNQTLARQTRAKENEKENEVA